MLNTFLGASLLASHSIGCSSGNGSTITGNPTSVSGKVLKSNGVTPITGATVYARASSGSALHPSVNTLNCGSHGGSLTCDPPPVGACAQTCSCNDGSYTLDLSGCSDLVSKITSCVFGVCEHKTLSCSASTPCVVDLQQPGALALNFSSPTYYTPENAQTGNLALEVADFDGDGNQDAFLNSTNVSWIFWGKGDGTFEDIPTEYMGMSADSRFITSGDFNDDGRIDLILNNRLWANTGGSRASLFTDTKAINTPVSCVNAPIERIVSGDFDEDNHLDIAVWGCPALDDLTLFQGTGSGTFTQILSSQNTLGSIGGQDSVGTSDINQDGNFDLVLGLDSESNIALVFGNGDGTLQTNTAQKFPTQGNTLGVEEDSLTIADFNLDGLMDVATLGLGPDPQIFQVLLGTSLTTLGTSTVYPMGSCTYDITARDLNGDGKPDLLALSDALGAANLCVVMNTSY